MERKQSVRGWRLPAWLAVIALAAMAGGCAYRPNDYSAFSSVDGDGWAYGNTYVYLPQVEDSVVDGSLLVAVRHTNDYPYSNLYLELSYQSLGPEGHVEFRRDTVNVELCDKYGHWLGSGSGLSYRLTDTVSTGFRLIDGAPLRLRHVMRSDRVTGLEQVGIIFTAND